MKKLMNAGGVKAKPKPVAPAPLPAPPPVVEAGYQSDEDDTAEPMSYDEKRQVSQPSHQCRSDCVTFSLFSCRWTSTNCQETRSVVSFISFSLGSRH